VRAEEPAWRPPARRADALRVLLVTGGHDHDVDFYTAFLGQDDLDVTVDGHPSVFGGPFGKTGRKVDVLVLYDMPTDVPEARRAQVQRYVEDGGAVVSLHHAISASPRWDWLHEVVLGARWRFEAEGDHPVSDFKHDEDIAVKVVARHPITEGIGDFRIFDETYGKLWWSPRIDVLLRTDHPRSDGPVAWVMPHPKARLCVIQLGHGREAHLSPTWQRLVRNAVRWAGGR
jgi:type 1 glutamine amidotransferase